MTELLTALSTGVTAFCATNLDDIFILMLFFTQVNNQFRRQHIITGQYLGFTALVITSMTGFFGHFLLPRPWIGLLGLMPIIIGLSRLINPEEDQETPGAEISTSNNSPLAGLLSPQTYGVAAVTFANGGDNIGIYVPLFANCSWQSLGIILGEFFAFVAVWCYLAYQLTRFEWLAANLTRYGNLLVPFVLIGLGIMILLDSHTLEHQGLAVLSLIISGLSVISLMNKASTNSLRQQLQQNTSK